MHAAGLGAVIQFIYGAVEFLFAMGIGRGIAAVTAGIKILRGIITVFTALGAFAELSRCFLVSFRHEVLL